MKNIKVLLIDDDEDDYILTQDVFNALPSNYELSWVDSFQKGLSAILKKEYDVYLLDYRLGNGNGIELLSEAINSGCMQPIIMLTGKGNAEVDHSAMEIGAADYLVKDNLEASLIERSIRYAINQTQIMQKLQTSELKYRTIFEQAVDPILVMDQEGTILDLNSGALRFFGYSREQITHQNSRLLFKRNEDADKFLKLLEQTGLVNDFECMMLTTAGDEVFCALSAFIHTDMLNVSEVYHTMIRDLSHRKNKEARSVNLGKMHISEHISKGLWAEMRDPLSTINLALDELAAEEALVSNESAQSYIEILKSNCDRIDQLVRNLIASTESNSLDVQKHLIGNLLNEVIEEAESRFAGEPIQLTKQILSAEDELFVDKASIKQAIHNVIQNAMEASISFPKQIHISTTVKKGMLQIGIEDNGIGIDPKINNRVFEPFFSTKMRAVGLGLTQAQRILTSHNGVINIQPLEKGTLLLMQIPLVYEEEG